MYTEQTKPNFIVIISGVEENMLIMSCFEVTQQKSDKLFRR